jgi:beta-lactamase regulating signal transducer with metallopeptidase domain
MIGLEGLTVWVVVAFVLWLAITLALRCLVRRRVGAGTAAAVLSWLIARAALSMMAPLLHWFHSHL